MDLSLGEVGLKRAEVLRMSWADLWRAIYGYWIRQDRDWDRTRHLMAMTYNMNRGKNKPAKKPGQLVPLPIDRLRDVNRQEWDEEKLEHFEKAKKVWDFSKGKELKKLNAEEAKKAL